MAQKSAMELWMGDEKKFFVCNYKESIYCT